MKRMLVCILIAAPALLGRTPGTIRWLHSDVGDSALFRRSIDTLDFDLNINGSHVWDFTENGVKWPEVDEIHYIKKARDGLFGSFYAESLLVIQNFSVLDTMETYYLNSDTGLFAHGFTTVRDRKATNAQIVFGGPARIMRYPSSVGDTWFDEYIMTSGEATVFAKSWFTLVDTGQLSVAIDTFPCMVVRIHQELEVKVLGVTIDRLTFYRYEWAVDSLTTLVTVQSRDDETSPLFKKAIKVARVTELSYYPPDSTPGVAEDSRQGAGDVSARSTAGGIKIAYTARKPGMLGLSLFDVSGRQASFRRLATETAGRHEFVWPVSVPAGVYLLRIEGDGISGAVKVVLVR